MNIFTYRMMAWIVDFFVGPPCVKFLGMMELKVLSPSRHECPRGLMDKASVS